MQDNSTMCETIARPLVLNVVNRANANKQRVEFTGTNCIIGSSEKANVRLDQLKPCHCEIVRNPLGLYVRQLGDSIQINGQVLPEAWIYDGDRIVIADIDVEIVDSGAMLLQQTAELARDVNSNATVAESNPGYIVEPTPVTKEVVEREKQQPEPVVQDQKKPEACQSEPCGNQCKEPCKPTAAEAAPATETPATEPATTLEEKVDSNINAAEQAINDGSSQAPENLSTVWSDDKKKDDQAKWLDQLYNTAVDEETPVAPEPVDSKDESQRWGADSIAPQLMQPNTDPSQFNHLPPPSAEEASRVFDKIEGVDSFADARKEIEQPEAVEPAEAINSLQLPEPEPAAPATPSVEAPGNSSDDNLVSEVSSSHVGTTEDGIPDVASVLRQLEQESLDKQPETEAPQAAKEEPIVQESVADVIARMRESGALEQPLPGEGENEAETTGIEEPAAQPAPIAPVQGEADTNQSAGGDDSVQDYMNQLMQRLRTDGTEIEPSMAQAAAAAETAAPVSAQEEDLTPVNPLTASEFQPREIVREKTSTLDALRQVANQSVENAVRKSAQEKSSETSLIYLAGSGACLFLSAVLFVLSNGVLDIAFILAIIFAVGCVATSFMFVSINSAKESLGEEPKKPRNKVSRKQKAAAKIEAAKMEAAQTE